MYSLEDRIVYHELKILSNQSIYLDTIKKKKSKYTP